MATTPSWLLAPWEVVSVRKATKPENLAELEPGDHPSCRSAADQPCMLSVLPGEFVIVAEKPGRFGKPVQAIIGTTGVPGTDLQVTVATRFSGVLKDAESVPSGAVSHRQVMRTDVPKPVEPIVVIPDPTPRARKMLWPAIALVGAVLFGVVILSREG